jgi:hypothetical protein
MTSPAIAAEPPDGARLYDDLKRYGTFGVHRYGSPGAEAALDWIAGELAEAGFAVTSQRFTMDRQYLFDAGTLAVGSQRVPVMPQWWIPEDRASFDLSAPLVASGEAPGAFVQLKLPYDRGAYLNDRHREALGTAFARHPAAVLLSIEHPSGEIFTYNVDQEATSWPVPVILVAPKDAAILAAAERSGTALAVSIRGSYRHTVAGRNVVARLDRGRGRSLVVSTPVTSWFTSTCERGPGIAAFLAAARQARHFGNLDLVFVATSGHEIGHGGMAHFMRDGAPSPDNTVAWVHFGSALACHDTAVKAILSSTAFAGLAARHFAAIDGTRLSGERAAIGEMREVHAAGYANFLGMAASHKYFHTPADDHSRSGPELLEPMAAAFAGALAEIAASAR